MKAVERIFKGNIKTPTVFIKISFVSAKLPEYITAGYQQFSVKLFIATPWQCNNIDILLIIIIIISIKNVIFYY